MTPFYNAGNTYQDITWTGTSNTTAYDLSWYGLNNTTQTALPSQWVVQAQQQMNAPAPTPRPRGFNRYVNASDMLEEFIAFVGEQGVRQGDVLGLPVELFIKWLVVQACEADGEEAPVTVEIPARPAQPRCLGCQRWMRRGVVMPLHGEECAARYFGRIAA